MRRRASAAIVVLYLGVVAWLGEWEHPDPDGLASSARGVAHGHVWQLLSSALTTGRGSAGPPLVLLAPAAVGALWLAGPARTLLAALAGHVGATLLVYAGLIVVRLIDSRLGTDAWREPDYGVSCVYAAWLGVSVGSTGSVAAAAAGVALFVLTVPVSNSLAGWEHAAAVLCGLGCAAPVAARLRGAVAVRRRPGVTR